MPTKGESDQEMESKTETPPPLVAATASDAGEGEKKEEEIGSMFDQLVKHVKSSYMNALYAFVPIAFIAKIAGMGESIVFIISFLALIPLAAALGDFTEDLALRTNEAIGALINVTFGNATELIISIMALRYGEFELIKNSLVGSVLGNMLLVLGTAFVVGGLKINLMKFSATAAQTYMASLFFACFGFIVPTSFFSLNSDASDPHFALAISREISLLMVGMYCLYIFFQMKTHKSLFEGEAGEDDEDEEPQFSYLFALIALAIVAVLISFLSDFMVESVSGAAEGLHLSKYFIGLVLIPIVGNVAEHASAIIMAAKGKLDIAVGIALGSSIQIGMFVMPLLVFIAWIFGQPLNMNVTPFTCTCLFAGIVLTFSIVSGGTGNYLTGAKLLAAYVMLVIAFLNAPEVVPGHIAVEGMRTMAPTRAATGDIVTLPQVTMAA